MTCTSLSYDQFCSFLVGDNVLNCEGVDFSTGLVLSAALRPLLQP